jgi:DNA ligase 1
MSTKPVGHQVVPGANGAEAANANHGAIRPRDSLFHWCGTADAIRQSAKREEKRALLDAYFGALAEESIAPAARFFCGRMAASREGRPVIIESGLIADAIQDLGRLSSAAFRTRYVEHGEIADAAAEVFAGRLPSGVSIIDVATWMTELVDAPGADARHARLRAMFARVSALEARYLVQLMNGTMEIGVDQALVEEALASAFGQPLEAVHRATVRGDIGEAATLARRRTLDEVQPAAT